VESYAPKFLGDGLRYEVSEFASRIYGHAKQGFCLTKEESIAMAGVVEKFLKECR